MATQNQSLIKLTAADKKYIKYIFTNLNKCQAKALKNGYLFHNWC
jgi:hypothetical protein